MAQGMRPLPAALGQRPQVAAGVGADAALELAGAQVGGPGGGGVAAAGVEGAEAHEHHRVVGVAAGEVAVDRLGGGDVALGLVELGELEPGEQVVGVGLEHLEHVRPGGERVAGALPSPDERLVVGEGQREAALEGGHVGHRVGVAAGVEQQPHQRVAHLGAAVAEGEEALEVGDAHRRWGVPGGGAGVERAVVGEQRRAVALGEGEVAAAVVAAAPVEVLGGEGPVGAGEGVERHRLGRQAAAGVFEGFDRLGVAALAEGVVAPAQGRVAAADERRGERRGEGQGEGRGGDRGEERGGLRARHRATLADSGGGGAAGGRPYPAGAGPTRRAPPYQLRESGAVLRAVSRLLPASALARGLLACGLLACGGAPAPTRAPKDAAGAARAIELTLPRLEPDGDVRGEVSLAALRGRVVLVTYFTAWCTPCTETLPRLAQLAAELDALEYVAVSLDERPHKAVPPLLEFLRIDPAALHLAIADGAHRDARTPFGALRAVPVTHLVDREGRYVETFHGIPPTVYVHRRVLELTERE